MSTILLIKKMLMRFFKFMYLNEEAYVDEDIESEVLAADVISSVVQIILCIMICFLMFVIPIYIYLK